METPTILPYRGRIPYNYSSSHNIYMLTALDQLFSVSSLICINGAFNLVFTSTMYQICTKIQILKHRFKMIMEQLTDNIQTDNPVEDIAKKTVVMTEKYQDQLIANWVESHNALLRLSLLYKRSVYILKYLINFFNFSLYDFTKSVFAKAVFIHYVINSIVMCTLAYILSHCEIDNIFIGNVFYFSVKCTQQYLQCSSAHQITLEVKYINLCIV